MLTHVALEAVGRIEHPVAAGTVASADRGAHRLVGTGVVLHGGIQCPTFIHIDTGTQEHVTEARTCRCSGRRQGDELVLKAEALCNTKAGQLRTRVCIQEAGGQAQREQVVVRNFVVADIGVLGEDGGKVEVVRPRVVIGQHALVAIGRAHIKRARLQRLHHAAPPVAGIPLKHQTCIQAESGHRAVGRTVAIGDRIVKLVSRGVQLQLGHHKTGRAQQGVTDLCQSIDALCIRLQRECAVCFKLGEVTLQGPIETMVIGLRVTRHQLGHAVVRRDDRRSGVLQSLPLEHTGCHAVRALRPAHGSIAGQKALRQGAIGGARKVAPIVVVAHPVHVQQVTHLAHFGPAGVHGAGLVDRGPPAVGAAQFVAGHVVGAQHSRVRGFQVTKFPAQIHATRRHQRGRDGGIALGCNVPVVRDTELRAVDAVGTNRGGQHARFALVAQRETDGRYRQDGHVLETQVGPVGNAHILATVEFNVCGLEHPVRHPPGTGFAPTGGVGGVVDHGGVGIHKIGAAGLAMGIALQKLVTRLDEKTLKGLHLEFQQWTFKHIAAAVDAHIAAGLGAVSGAVVLQPVRLDDSAGFTQFGLTFDHRLQIGTARNALAHQKRRCFVALGWRQGLDQPGAALQAGGLCLGALCCGRRLLGLHRHLHARQGHQGNQAG